MSGTKQTVWFIGEARDRELRFCLRELRSISKSQSVETYESIDEVLDPATHQNLSQPDMVVVFQDWSNQYRETQINQLLSLTMGSRLLCVYGSWCESDGRNTDLWPHGTRIAARNAAERFEREVNSTARNQEPLPLTAGRDERFEYNHAAKPPGSLRKTSVCVLTSDRRLQEGLETRLAANGVEIHEDTRVCDAIIWAPDVAEQTQEATNAMVREHKPRKVIPMRAMAGEDNGYLPMLITDRQLSSAVSSR